MKNILIITQKVDEDDDLLGFFVSWIREFSKKFEKVFVITLAEGTYKLSDNVFVYSLGKEKDRSRFSRILKFYYLLFKLVPKSSGIFAHMSPIFVIAVWPVALIFRKKIILWYLHRSVTFRLKIAEKLVNYIVTAAKDSLNFKSRKILEVGHGIDIEKFRTQREWNKNDLLKEIKILSVGRISKIKDYETLIRSALILRDKGLNFKLKIIGRPVMAYDFEYFKQLKKMVTDLDLNKFVEFVGFVPYSQITDYYKDSHILINLTPSGGIDKAVLEAMASGSLVLVSNLIFKKYFGTFSQFLIFRHGNPEDLFEKIKDLLSLPEEKLRDMVNFLQMSVSKSHSVSQVVTQISQII